MSDVHYYLEKDPETDLTYINAIAAGIEQWLVDASGSGGGIFVKTLRLAGQVGVGGQVVEDTLDITINSNNNTATVAGAVVDLTLTNAAGLLAEAILTEGAILLGLGTSGIWLSVTAAVVTEVFYSVFLESTVDAIIDELLGTVNVDLQLKDSSGNVLGGGMYKDGLGTVTELDAVKALIQQSIDNAAMPDTAAGMSIDIVTAGATPTVETYEIESGAILQQIADFAGVTLQAVRDYTDPFPGSFDNSTNGEIITGTSIPSPPRGEGRVCG